MQQEASSHRSRLYAAQRDQNLARAREGEYARENLGKYLSKQAIYATAAQMDETIEQRRRKLDVEALAREEAMEALTRTAALESRRRAFEQKQEMALAKELEATRREEESRRLEIQRICEADPSLRELQSKLKMAYIQRERGEQLVEKESLKSLERQTQLQMDAAMERARLAALEAERRAREEERLKGEERKRTLEAQLEERQIREFISAEQEAKREKGLVDAILAKIAAEDEAEAAQKARARAEVIKAIEDFKGQRERAVAAALAAEREEAARIAAFLAQQSHREEASKAGKAEDAAAREAQYRLLVAAEEERRRKQEEEDQLRWVLVDDEADRRRAAEESKKREREDKIRAEMKAANEHQRFLREKTAAEERAKEEKLIAQFLRKCAEDDEKDARARRAREEAIARYKSEVAQQRDVRAALFEEQKMEEIRFAEEARRREEFKRRVVAEARRKLLQEHAAALRGFLPRGVIVSPADLDILKAFDGNKDGELNPEEMALAQAAFQAFDPGAARAGAGAGAAAGAAAGAGAGAEGTQRAPLPPLALAGGGGGAAAQGAQQLTVAQRNRAAQQKSSVF